MSFEVAIYNAGCDDGKRVIDSIKAAYLYADKVRVYDFLYSEYFDKTLVANEQSRQFRSRIDYGIPGFNTAEIVADSFSRVTNNMHHLRQQNNSRYNKKQYRTDLNRLGIKLIAPKVNANNLGRINEVFREFVVRCRKDPGYKLFNSYPRYKGVDSQISSLLVTALLSEHAISKLPGFENASIDEMIDIRDELDGYIVPYRNAIVDMSRKINGIQDKESLRQECVTLYLNEIEPRVAAINEAVRDNNVFKNIARSAITSELGWTGIGSMAVAIATKGDISNALMSTAIAVGGYSITKGIKITQERKKELQENELYFLYEAGSILETEYS